jgi:hypothetical protein
MKTYAISLDAIRLLADAVSQLDHTKNYLPAGCAAQRESARLAVRGHAILATVLGADEPLVYPTLEEETIA